MEGHFAGDPDQFAGLALVVGLARRSGRWPALAILVEDLCAWGAFPGAPTSPTQPSALKKAVDAVLN